MTPEQELENVLFRIEVISNRAMQGKGDGEKRTGWLEEKSILLKRKAELQDLLGIRDLTIEEKRELHTKHPVHDFCAKCGGTWPCVTVKQQGWIAGKSELYG